MVEFSLEDPLLVLVIARKALYQNDSNDSVIYNVIMVKMRPYQQFLEVLGKTF